MRERSGAIFIACGIGLSVLAAAPLYSPAHGQSADLVLCDRIAADPADPDKPADVKGVPQVAPSDIETAIKYCKIAAAKSRRALYQLGRAYAANRQMPEALRAYRRAVDKGSTSAMVELGVMLGTGAGVLKDQAAARELFERAAKAGNPRGMINLEATSGGTPSNPAEARALLAKAADANSAEAQFQMGIMLAEGTGGPKDDVAARALFEKSAAQGHADAMMWAGAFAQIGRGGPEDSRAARSYYEKAAALGNEDAKARLKNMDCPYVLKDKRGNVMTHLCF
jgi:TPR repeat protein